MKRLQLCALLFLAVGCSSRTPAPVVTVAPRPTAPTFAPIVVPTLAPTAPSPVVVPPINATIANGTMSEKERQLILSQIQMLKTASSDQDFETAWLTHDYRLCGVYGYSTYCPGVPNKRFIKLLKQYGVKHIEGTGDFFRIPEQLELQQLADKYAFRYNQLLLARLDEQKPAVKPEISAE